VVSRSHAPDRLERATSLMEQLRADGAKPSQLALQHLFRASRGAGDPMDTMVAQMKLGLPPKRAAFNALVRAYVADAEEERVRACLHTSLHGSTRRAGSNGRGSGSAHHPGSNSRGSGGDSAAGGSRPAAGSRLLGGAGSGPGGVVRLSDGAGGGSGSGLSHAGGGASSTTPESHLLNAGTDMTTSRAPAVSVPMLLHVMSMCNLGPNGATLQQLFSLARTVAEIDTLVSRAAPPPIVPVESGPSRPQQRRGEPRPRGGCQDAGDHLVHAELAARARISDEQAAGVNALFLLFLCLPGIIAPPGPFGAAGRRGDTVGGAGKGSSG
jgi:hypothetical protein